MELFGLDLFEILLYVTLCASLDKLGFMRICMAIRTRFPDVIELNPTLVRRDLFLVTLLTGQLLVFSL